MHVIAFEAWKYGGSFSVDIGMHFAEVPPLPSITGGPGGASECWLLRRLRRAGEQFFGYGNSQQEAEELVRDLADEALAEFATFAKRWGDGLVLLDVLTPEVLNEDQQLFRRALVAPSRGELEQLREQMTICRLFPGWLPFVGPTAVMLAFLALACGRKALVREYLAFYNIDHTTCGDRWHTVVQRLKRNARK